MAQEKKGFVLYCDLIHTVDKMPNEKAGELFKHILNYVNDKEPKTDDLIIELTFEPIKQQLKRDLSKWKKKQEQRKEAGRISAEKRKAAKQESVERNSTTVDNRNKSLNEGEQTSTVIVTGTGTVTVKGTVIEDIEEIYKFYPSKCPIRGASSGKSSKDKSKIEKLLKSGQTKKSLMSIISNYVEDCKKHNVYLKNFATFLNNLPEEETVEHVLKKKKNRFECDFMQQHYKIFECDTEEEARKMYYDFGGTEPTNVRKLT